MYQTFCICIFYLRSCLGPLCHYHYQHGTIQEMIIIDTQTIIIPKNSVSYFCVFVFVMCIFNMGQPLIWTHCNPVSASMAPFHYLCTSTTSTVSATPNLSPPLPIITLQCLFVYFQPGHTTTKRLSHKSSEIARSSKIWKKTSPFQLRFWSRHCVTWLWSGQGILCQNILQRIFLKSGLRCVLCPVIAFCVF